MIFLAWLGLSAADAFLTGLSFTLDALDLNPFLGTVALVFSLVRMLLSSPVHGALGGSAVVAERRAYNAST